MHFPGIFRPAKCAGITCSDGGRIGVRFEAESGEKCYFVVSDEDARFLALALLNNLAVGDVGGSLTAAKNERGDGKRCISSREFKEFDVQVEEAMAALAALRERVREEHLEAKKGGLVK